MNSTIGGNLLTLSWGCPNLLETVPFSPDLNMLRRKLTAEDASNSDKNNRPGVNGTMMDDSVADILRGLASKKDNSKR